MAGVSHLPRGQLRLLQTAYGEQLDCAEQCARLSHEYSLEFLGGSDWHVNYR